MKKMFIFILILVVLFVVFLFYKTKYFSIHPNLNKTVGVIGHGETFPSPGVYGSFVFITFNDNKGKEQYSNISELKIENLKEGEKMIVYYDSNDPTKFIVYNSQKELVYDNITK